MKLIITLFIVLCSIWSAKAQSILFNPIELPRVNTYNTVEDLYSTENARFYSSISDVFLYTRSDTTFIAYWRSGYLQEFSLDVDLVYPPSEIRRIEFIDNAGSDDLLVIEAYTYESQTGSSSVQRFQNTTKMLVVNLETHAVIFEDEVGHSFHQTTYVYEESLYQDSISDEHMEELINTREEEVEEYSFEYQVEVNGKEISVKCIKPFDGQEDHYSTNLIEGVFIINNGVYKRK